MTIDLFAIKTLKPFYFDLECMPGGWIGGDYVSRMITAAAWAEGNGKIEVMTHYEYTVSEIAEVLAEKIEAADLVVGHYIRGFDLPLLNGELLRNGLLPIDHCLVQDTKMDLVTAGGRSKSQENLAAELGIPAPKVKINLPQWEAFNTRRGAPGGKVEKVVIERVVGDVKQNRQLHKALREFGWLGTPREWRPKVQSGTRYSG